MSVTAARRTPMELSANTPTGWLRASHLLLTFALLSGCATDNPLFREVSENAKGIRDARSCCATIEDALAVNSPLDATFLAFDARARHFDFGLGLAPFVVLAVDGRLNVLEVQSPLQLLGWAYGGDGVARHVDVRVFLFDDQRGRLPAKLLDKAVRFTGPGSRGLFHYFELPANVRHVVVSTDPASNGKQEWSAIHANTEPRLQDGKPRFFVPSVFPLTELLPRPYTLASYGPIAVQGLTLRE